MKIKNIVEAIPLEDYHIVLKFNDGIEKKIDIRPFIKNGVSSKLKDFNYFKKVQVVDGFITWDNGFDFCPNFLYQYTPY
jgi:hypothetical protein